MADAKYPSGRQPESFEIETTEREASSSQVARGKPDEPKSLLDNVLNETVGEGTPLSADEWNALRDVAKKHRGVRFDTQPVGLALVGSLLRLRFRDAESHPTAWREMIERVTEALFESPHARLRLEQLWRKLDEATR